MKDKNTGRLVFAVLSVVCTLGAFASVRLNLTGDIDLLLLMYLVPLMGFFACLALDWWGVAVIAGTALLTVAADGGDRFGTSDVLAWLEWLFDVVIAMVPGVIGFLIALLCRYWAKHRSSVHGVLSGLMGVWLAVCYIHSATAILGDPIVSLQMRQAANQYVAQNYPDEDYVISSSHYDALRGRYCYYYQRSDGRLTQGHYACEVSCKVDNDWPVARYFSSYTVEDHLIK